VGRDKVGASDNMYAFELWVDIDHCGMSTRKHVIYAKASTHLLWYFFCPSLHKLPVVNVIKMQLFRSTVNAVPNLRRHAMEDHGANMA
jgi:hypothetical protein